MAEIPLRGDRSARDMGYPHLHSSDIESATPTYHAPVPTAPNTFIVSRDGQHWVSEPYTGGGGGGAPITIMHQTVITFPGVLTEGANPLMFFNLFGSTQEILKVFISVGTAPVGQDIIVDVYVNGVSLFTNQAHRPKILAGQTTGVTTSIDRPSWYNEFYVTASVIQVGSTTEGSDLTVHIVHCDNAGQMTATAHCFIRGGSEGSAQASAHCFIEAIAADGLRASAPCFIRTPTWDISANAPCFIQGGATPTSENAPCFIWPLTWGAVGRSTNVSLTYHDWFQYFEMNKDSQFPPDEPEDPDDLYHEVPELGPEAFLIEQTGLYEIFLFTDMYNMEDVVVYGVTWDDFWGYGANIQLHAQPVGNSNGSGSDWKNRQYSQIHWIDYFEGSDTSEHPAYIYFGVKTASSPNYVFGSTGSFSPRFLIRRLS